jgi:uncharacterized protein YndB with AHSA1/START domain
MDEPLRITVEQHVAAPPATVYAYLTDAERWVRWQGADATLDPAPGGIFRIQMGTGETARGEFVELVPDRKVVFTWGWIDRPDIPPGSTIVEIDLEPAGQGTLVRLTHRQLPPDEADAHAAGWRHYLGRLALAAADREPGPDRGPAGPGAR